MTSNVAGEHEDSSRNLIRQRISRWIHRALPASILPKQTPALPKPPPPLPSTRHQFTRHLKSNVRHPQDESSLFARLPAELRREILAYAFGNRTMHMHLEFEHPMVKHNDAREAHAEYSWYRDLSSSKQWMWRSCVCHRNPPWIPSRPLWWRIHWQRPDTDSCMNGTSHACGSWLGTWPGKCHIGIMGWLLSCQRAYEEGVDVLYATNTFHVSGEYLLVHLSDYIAPARLAHISSLEVNISLTIPQRLEFSTLPLKPSADDLSLFLNMLAQKSNIKQLFLCIKILEFPEAAINTDISDILDATDAFLRASNVESVVLQIRSDALSLVDVETATIDEDTESDAWESKPTHQLWRSLDGDAKDAKVEKRQCYYPMILAPLRNPASPELGQSRGYWLLPSVASPPFALNMP